MPVVDLSSYHQPSGTGADGTKLDNMIDAVQAALNGLDKNNLVANAGILASQLAGTDLPGHEIAYVEFTGTVSSTTATEAAPLDVVSAGSVTFDGTPVVVEFFCEQIENVGAINNGFNLWEDATDRGRLFDSNAQAVNTGGTFKRRYTPSAGAHTLKVRLWTSGASTFQLSAGAGGVGARMPGFIRITKA